jgi:glycine oxidase
MLAPVTELTYTETSLHQLGVASLRRYPDFVAELEQATGLECGLVECGTVSVAWDGADLAALRDVRAFAAGLGVEATLLSGRELRALEPGLAPGIPGGMHVPGDHQVDPRLLQAALLTGVRRAGVRLLATEAGVTVAHDRVTGVQAGDVHIAAATVVVAAGTWSGRVAGLPPELTPPVRPVKGQTLRLRLPAPERVRPVVRAEVKGSHVYVVPRRDGGVVVGASVEEAGFDVRPRAGAVYELLRDAQSVLPELGEAVLEDVSTGLRPGSPDNAPIVGAADLPGLVFATGHYRNGVLLTPITADAVAELILTGGLPEALRPFTPQRFDTAKVAP